MRIIILLLLLLDWLTPSFAQTESTPSILKGARIQIRLGMPDRRLVREFSGFRMSEHRIGEIIDTTGSPWNYGLYQKHGLEWFRQSVAYVMSGQIKAAESGHYTFGVFIDTPPVEIIEPSSSLYPLRGLTKLCHVSACLGGDSMINEPIQSHEVVMGNDWRQFHYTFSDQLEPGYHPLQLTVSCMAIYTEGRRSMFHYDRGKIGMSLKMTTPSGSGMQDVAPDILVHKTEPDPDDEELVCW